MAGPIAWRKFALYAATCAVVSAAALAAPAAGALSIGRAIDPVGVRAAQVAMQAQQIANVPRNLTIGDDVVPMYTGPLPLPGSLAEALRLREAALITSQVNFRPTYVAGVAVAQRARISSMAEYASLYDLISARIPRPLAADNSDVSFGRQRLTVKAMKLRRVKVGEFLTPRFQLSNAELAQICGVGVKWATIRLRKALFVEDFADAADWNDPAKTNYIPSVVGFFCYNARQQALLPIEIRFPDTRLAYSPLDTSDEWTLAKMGLNAASTASHQWQHMAETHATTIPIRVELYRTMAPVHPVRALLLHHMMLDFGLEMLAEVLLFKPGTPHDKLFGWGAKGSALFVDYQLRTDNSLQRDFLTDLRQRGLDEMPAHKYANYGRRLYDAIATFVRRYVGVYYPSDAFVAGDPELQSWARACASVPHLKDFPREISSTTQLQKLLTHLVFLSTARHHAMNSFTTWHSMAVPYSVPSLWKPLPGRKLGCDESLDLMEYTVPLALAHEALGLSALFYRDLAANQTLQRAYRVEPFASEPLLQPAIDEFEMRMDEIDNLIQRKEARESVAYELLRPSMLPVNEWI